MANTRIESIAHHLETTDRIATPNDQADIGSKMTTTTTTTKKVFRLIPGVQSYDWGIQGSSSSRVAQFASATKELDFKAEDDKPYAELWMGTHPSMPSRIIAAGQPEGNEKYQALSSYLAQHPELIGEKVVAKFSDEKPGCLPFLFKVLSVGKALSIQAHPDKALGKRLHEQRPDVYKDPNHKPEMAIALTAFRGFCGFRPLEEIVHFIKTVPEFAQLVKLSDVELQKASSSGLDESETKAILKTIFSNLMNSPASAYEPLAAQLSERFAKGTVEGVPEMERKLVLKLASEFPEDIGIFCTFLLNISTLQPGEALFLQANEPHAYLEGEILECMASSDNVVRAGLTPKLRDTETLIEMCTYQSGSNRGRLSAKHWDKSSPKQVEALLYDPPIEEFSVVTIKLEQGQEVKNAPVDGPSIVLVMDGVVEIAGADEVVEVERGQVAFVAAGVEVKVKAGEGEARLTRAFVEV